jgi:hypothetical protein
MLQLSLRTPALRAHRRRHLGGRLVGDNVKATIIAGGLALLLNSVPVQGAILHEQDFEALSLGSLSGQDGYTAMAQAQVASGGLTCTNGDVSVAGGAKCVAFSGLPISVNNWVFSRTFAEQSGTVYFSLAMTWTNMKEDKDMLLFALSNDVHTSPVALANSAGVHINFNGTFVPGLINGRIRGNTTGDTTATSSGKAGGANTTSPQFIVGCIDKDSSTNYNRLRLWVNPTSYKEGTPDVAVTRDIGISSGLDTFFFFSGADNQGNETMKADNIRIGTTWADVMPSSLRGTVIVVH